MNRELAYWVATSAIAGVGTVTFSNLLNHFKTLKRFWEASESEIIKLKRVDSKTKESIISFRKNVDPKVFLAKVYEYGIKVVTIPDRQYPANLRQIAACPPVLYFLGNLFPRDDLAVAVVGSRYPTPYGRQVTEKLTYELSKQGLTIVSGLARGIDSIAHRTALDAGGRTIAVLGCGLDIVYPAENKALAQQIARRGAVVSEFPLGFPPVQSNFAARNRIISGLSLGVLITEAAVDSGTLITAGHAAEQGRDVFAVPGPINSKNSEGVNALIKDGVHIATSSQDVVEILNIEKVEREKELEIVSVKNTNQAKILEILDGEAKHIDFIAREVKLPIESVSSELSLMEISGFIKNYGSGVWGK